MNYRSHRYIIHPILFGIIPLLYTFSDTFPQFQIEQTYRSIGISLVIMLIVFSFWRIILRSWERAGLVSSWFFVLYSSYGSAYQYMSGHYPGAALSRADILMAIWTSALIIGAWFLIRVLRQTALLTLFFNATAVILVSFNVVGIFYKGFTTHYFERLFTPMVHEKSVVESEGLRKQDNLPDIYYIILDGYGRSDVLKEVFNLDNSSLVDYLKNKGFYVAENSFSNYSQTRLSLTSSLNIEYLDQLIVNRSGTFNEYDFETFFQHNYVMKFFTEKGYRTYAFDPGINIMTRDVDVFVPRDLQLNPFEMFVVQNSMSVLWIGPLAKNMYFIDTNAEFMKFRNIIDDPGPKFVYFHVLNPHPPFVMGSDGEEIPNLPYSIGDGNQFSGTNDEYTFGYSEQAKYVDTQVKDILDQIFLHPGEMPIIIIQGDHGSRKYAVFTSVEETCVHECMSILNAYYFPDGDYSELYPDISPVNSFRVVINQLFGMDLELLTDQHYYWDWDPSQLHLLSQDRLAQPCQLK